MGGNWYWKTHRPAEDDTRLVLYGNVDIRQVELAINANERIAKVLVEEGDRIKKGQLLARLETERFQYAVDRAAAQVKTQRQVVARLVAGSRPEEICQARAEVAAAGATARDLETRYRRAITRERKTRPLNRTATTSRERWRRLAQRSRQLSIWRSPGPVKKTSSPRPKHFSNATKPN